MRRDLMQSCAGVLGVILATTMLAGPVTAQVGSRPNEGSGQHARHSEPSRRGPRTTVRGIRHWTNQLADELDHLSEDLHYEDARGSLVDAAEQAYEATVHFQQVLQRRADLDHLRRDFREMDTQIHDLLDALTTDQPSGLGRAVARVRYADDQLHYFLTAPVAEERGSYRELVARHAHVLEQESRRLERALRQDSRGGRGRGELLEIVGNFAEEAEHFHEVVEKGAERDHLREDFQDLDEVWHDAASEINRSQTGIWARRTAARVNNVHNQLHTLLRQGSHVPSYRPRGRRGAGDSSRPQIEFELPGVGRFQLGPF